MIIWPQSTGPGEYEDDRPPGRALLAAVSAKSLTTGQGLTAGQGPASRPGSVTLVEEEIPAAALRAAYARMDLMVASVSYLGSKAPGVMQELGLGEWVLDLWDLPAGRLETAVLALWERREDVRRHLRTRISGVVAQARTLDRLIASLVRPGRPGITSGSRNPPRPCLPG